MCRIELVNDDCFSYLKTLKSESVSLVLTDPPYEVSRDTNFASGDAKGKDTDRFHVSMDFGDWDADFDGLDEVIKECYRVLKPNGTLLCFYDIWKITRIKGYKIWIRPIRIRRSWKVCYSGIIHRVIGTYISVINEYLKKCDDSCYAVGIEEYLEHKQRAVQKYFNALDYDYIINDYYRNVIGSFIDGR